MCKERMVDEIVASLRERPNFVITKYMGSSVAELEQLRKSLKRSSSSYLVVKNSVLRVVFDKLEMKEEQTKIADGMGLSLSGDDIIATCKALATFAKDHSKFKIEGAVIDGKSVTHEKVRELASLPSKHALLTLMVVSMKSPISGFVNVLGGILRKFVCVVDAIKTSKQNAPSGAQS